MQRSISGDPLQGVKQLRDPHSNAVNKAALPCRGDMVNCSAVCQPPGTLKALLALPATNSDIFMMSKR